MYLQCDAEEGRVTPSSSSVRSRSMEGGGSRGERKWEIVSNCGKGKADVVREGLEGYARGHRSVCGEGCLRRISVK